MDDLSFLHAHSDGGDAVITVLLPNGNNRMIPLLNVEFIAQRCPLLALCFEDGQRGLHHSFEANSATLVICFLRFIYTENYIPQGYEDWRDGPVSLLLHTELCRLGDIYDLPALTVQAHYNVICETELACGKPDPPKDLCNAICYIYEHLAEQRELVDTILHYCVSEFTHHGLAQNEAFRKVAYELRPFHNDLCRTNFKRGFEDAGAGEIICLPVQEINPSQTLAQQNSALGDFLYELWSDSTPMTTPHFGPSTTQSPDPTYALVHRPGKHYNNATIDDSDGSVSDGSLSDVEGFSLVHRPKTTSIEARDIFDDTETGWLGISELPNNNGGLYMQADMNASTTTIRPMTQNQPLQAREFEEAYSSDSDWSVIDSPAVRRRSFV